MNAFRTWWKPFAGLAFCLIYPSTAIFKHVGYVPLVAYICAAIGIMLLILWIATRTSTLLTPRACLLSLSLLLLSLLSAFVVVHPRIDTDGFRLAGISFGASDANNAIDVAIEEFVKRRYPYHAKTFLGNPITPMPGALLLAAPFYYTSNSAVQNIFWLSVFFAFVAIAFRSVRVAFLLACMVFFVSPNVAYHVLTGSDYISNSIYLIIFAALLLESVQSKKPFWISACFAVLLGIGLSSRMNFVVMLPLVFFALGKAGTPRAAYLLIAIVLVSFSAITAPFFLYDPTGFSPLHTVNKLSLGGAFRWAPFALPCLAGLLSIVIALTHRTYSLPIFMRDVALIQIVLILGGQLLASISIGRLNLEYPHFGLLFLFFGCYAYGPATLIRCGIPWSTSADMQTTQP